MHALFEEEEWGEYHGLDIATHMFIAVRLPQSVFSDSAQRMVQMFTMTQRPEKPLFVYIIQAEDNADTGCGCFIAIMK